ncbi:MAG: class I SAM-dependent methyltransferase [Alicyclobacillus shizuokensis]|nr:class I SAM-dependent methyltransferase [Alicyclobacillus shizuokensis]
MPIDFHDKTNRNTYASRIADTSWRDTMRSLLDARGLRVADIGCGGGIYSRAWIELGARSVIGVDSSSVMVEAAREHSSDYPALSFIIGDAAATGLTQGSVDVVFARALIHHLKDLDAFTSEARRILTHGGWLIIQDRTPEDVNLPGSPQHVRGYFFERFPRLLDAERSRRWTTEDVASAMRRVGFTTIGTVTFWETRRRYGSFNELAEDLRARTGRSILHDLNEEELRDSISFIEQKVAGNERIIETDRWTVWHSIAVRRSSMTRHLRPPE